MKVLFVILLVTLSAPLWGQSSPPEPSGPAAQPVLFDAEYEWRFRGSRGWHGAEAMFRVPLHFGRTGEDNKFLGANQIGLLGRYERAYGDSPGADRAGLVSTYTFSVEGPATPDGGGFYELRQWGFPFQRASGISVSATIGLGWMHSRGTQDNPERQGVPASQDAIRVEHEVHMSVLAIGLRARAAMNVNLRDGTGYDWEAGAWLTVGYRLLPVGLSLGFLYLGTERAGGTCFSVRLSIHL